MPYSTKPLTTELVFSFMKPGVVYSPHVIGYKVKTPAAEVKKNLVALVALGKVTPLKMRKGTCYIVAGTEHLRRKAPEKPEIDPATIALPRMGPPLTKNLVGYQAEISRRTELAMMTRPR